MLSFINGVWILSGPNMRATISHFRKKLKTGNWSVLGFEERVVCNEERETKERERGKRKTEVAKDGLQLGLTRVFERKTDEEGF